ncbi:MAG: NAD(P)/FAD-dependent oxidoreductase [Aestuariivirga sp.]|nr:NAD(P)/FAD-dependent oxidoreductase [Aestuariivirga sp.]
MPVDVDPNDIVIVGAGPVGLYAAYYAGFRGLKTTVVDALPEAGGQITAMYPEKEIRDVAGFASIRGTELVNNLLQQAAQHDYNLLLSETVGELDTADDGLYRLTTSEGRVIVTRAILIAAGLGSFTPKSLPTIQAPLPEGVLHFVPKLSALDGQDVVIVGGGDSAVDWALAAIPRAKSVAVVHRRARFRAHEANVEEMRSGRVRIIAPGEIQELRAGISVEAVVVRQPGAGDQVLPCDKLIMALGFTSDLGPLGAWGLERIGIHFCVRPDMQTSRERIFAAGDVSEYPGKVRLISVGFGEAAIAVNHIAAAIDPAQQVFPGHSTHGAE